MFFLPIGGVLIILISFISDNAELRVLGIGVAVRDKTSISSFIPFIISLCLTPNLCSSSMISKPKSLYLILLLKSACVPIII